MTRTWGVALGWAVAGLIAASAGCTSSLKVRKISVAARGTEKDYKVKGFRYYLSRPYVVIKDDIIVKEEIELVPVDEDKQNPLFYHFHPSLNAQAATEVTAGQLRLLKGRVERMAKTQPVSYVTEDLDAAGRAAAETADAVALADEKVPTEAGVHLAVPATAPQRNKDTAFTRGNIEVIFLPDLDEQYAVHNHNCLGKSAYSLHFRNGWELTDVSGEFDSTTVAIELLTAIDTAINAAKSVEIAGIDREARAARARATTPATGKELGDEKAVRKDNHPFVQVVRRRLLKKGVYRINKPWEIEGGLESCSGPGLLAKLGLPFVDEVQVFERIPVYDINPLIEARTGKIRRVLKAAPQTSQQGPGMPLAPPADPGAEDRKGSGALPLFEP